MLLLEFLFHYPFDEPGITTDRLVFTGSANCAQNSSTPQEKRTFEICPFSPGNRVNSKRFDFHGKTSVRNWSIS